MGAEPKLIVDNRMFFKSIIGGSPDFDLLTLERKFTPSPGVYAIFNKAKNKVYIGQSFEIWARMCAHRSLLNTNSHHCLEMSRDYQSNSGDFVFFTIEVFNNDKSRVSKHILIEAEKAYIEMTPKDMLYNSTGADRKQSTHEMQISIQYIGKRIGLSSDSIRLAKNQLGFNSDMIPIEAAINYVSARVTPGGRRTTEQAEAAKKLLSELQSGGSGIESPIKSPTQPNIEKVYENSSRKNIIWLPLVASSLASIGNMWLICKHLTDGDIVSTAILTAVFSMSALFFIYSNANTSGVRFLTWILIGFEAFCNTTGVYYGLLGRTGAPTRFLGMVTDIFNGGTHYMAIVLGAAMALIIGAVQIVSIKTITKWT